MFLKFLPPNCFRPGEAVVKRKIVIGVCALMLGAGAVLCLLPYNSYCRSYIEAVRNQLRSSGVALTVEHCNVSLPRTIHADKIGLVVPMNGFPVPILIDAAEMKVELASLFLFRAAFDASFHAYGGVISSFAAYSLLGSPVEFSIYGTALDLSTHPLTNSFGLRGKLNLVSQGVLNQGDAELGRARSWAAIGSGDIRLNISQGEIRGGQVLFGFIPIPHIEMLNGDATFVKTENVLVLRRLQLTFSLGTLSGKGKCTLGASGAQRMNFQFNLDLTPDGVLAVGQYLALAANLQTEHPPAMWILEMSKDEKSPALTFLAIPRAD